MVSIFKKKSPTKVGGEVRYCRLGGPDNNAIAKAVTEFSNNFYTTVPLEGISSPLGLWLLLASQADNIADHLLPQYESLMGLPREELLLAALYYEDFQDGGISVAFGTWVSKMFDSYPNTLKLSYMERLLNQSQLDQWASDHTAGMVKEFPIKITDLTALVLASAILAKTQWDDPLESLGSNDEQFGNHPALDKLMLMYGNRPNIAAVVRVDGDVLAVAKPHSNDVNVWSFAANKGTSKERLLELANAYLAAPESYIPVKFRELEALFRNAPGEVPFVPWKEVREVLAGDDSQVRAVLPRWKTESLSIDLLEAPGVSATVDSILSKAPILDPNGVQVKQSAAGEYNNLGFQAAAVSAMGFGCLGIPQYEKKEIRCLDIRFDRDHLVVATGQKVLENVPIFYAWVTPEMWTEFDAESLERFMDLADAY